jgi:hypothetical protein
MLLFCCAALPLSRKTWRKGELLAQELAHSPHAPLLPLAPASSPRPSTFCRSARHNQDEKGSVQAMDVVVPALCERARR